MTRALLAAALIGAVLVGGFIYGALGHLTADTGPDW